MTGKACLITGASSGLGRSTAHAMAAAGAHLALVARSAGDLDQAAEEAGSDGRISDGRILTIPADLGDVDMNEQVVQRTVDVLGRLDVVINAAATDVPKTVAELTADDWDRVLAINLRAPFLLAKHSFPHLRQAGGGTLVNVSSIAGRRGWGGASAYCASKFGLTGLTQALNAEGRPDGIRACVVYPGAMDTRWGDWTPEEREQSAEEGGRDPHEVLPPSQVADLLVWIASAPAGLVLNESIVTPLHEQGWP